MSNRDERADIQHLPMIAGWIAVGLAMMVALASRPWRHSRAEQDLGFVSHQWLAEYRTSHMSDAER